MLRSTKLEAELYYPILTQGLNTVKYSYAYIDNNDPAPNS